MGEINSNARLQGPPKGADVASASTLTVGTDGNYFVVTGTTTVNYLTTTSFRAGAYVVLEFSGITTITNNASSVPGGTAAFLSRSGRDIKTRAGAVYAFWYNGTNWVEPGFGGALMDGVVQVKTDTDYTILATDCVVIAKGLTATRTLTLPAVSAMRDYQVIWIFGDTTVSGSNTLVVSRAGSDTLRGSTTRTATTSRPNHNFIAFPTGLPADWQYTSQVGTWA